VIEGDLTMDDEWLEKVNVANLFKSFGVVVNEPPPVDAIEMTLNELKITAEVSAGNSNALDLVQFSMKEVADKLSSISLTDDKAVLENEIKKPLVEALKLAASNKKLEAELKSLQKEHNMLKDMVKGLEQIHGEKKDDAPPAPAFDKRNCVIPMSYCLLPSLELGFFFLRKNKIDFISSAATRHQFGRGLAARRRKLSCTKLSLHQNLIILDN
jgi:hypothetical protein